MKIFSNYRKIYEQFHGPIPVDEDGRSFDVHHIDGNHSNNDIANLMAVSIQEHYDIHYSQEDYGACFKINQRLKMTPEETSKMVSLFNQERVKNGTHPFLGGKLVKKRMEEGGSRHLSKLQKQRVEDGIHNFLSEEFKNNRSKYSSEIQKKRVANGTNPFLGGEIQKQSNLKRIKDRTHNFLTEEFKELKRQEVLRQLENGTHNFQKRKKCPYCELESNPGTIGFHIKSKHKEELNGSSSS